jgi:hypothetical protein
MSTSRCDAGHTSSKLEDSWMWTLHIPGDLGEQKECTLMDCIRLNSAPERVEQKDWFVIQLHVCVVYVHELSEEHSRRVCISVSFSVYSHFVVHILHALMFYVDILSFLSNLQSLVFVHVHPRICMIRHSGFAINAIRKYRSRKQYDGTPCLGF